MIQSIFGRVTEIFFSAGNALVRNSRVMMSYFRRSSLSRPSQDWSRPDYQFWVKAYYCRAAGLELSGLFIRPLVNKIAAWSLGRAPNWKVENEATGQALTDWWNENHTHVLRSARAALRQGDSFIVVNADLTLTLVPPDLVEPIVNEENFADIIGWRVTQVQQHPERTAEKMTIVDEYYTDRRIHRREKNAVVVEETIYPNLLGRLPIVHIANQPDDGETFGHAEAEALLDVLHRYGETFEAAIAGNVRQGRPTPVLSFDSVADLNAFWDANGTTETRTLPDGTDDSSTVLSIDLTEILTVSGAQFEYKSPGSFSQDTERLLGLMFYLILEHTELPEFVFGNAIASSKASADTQMPIFVRFIEMRRGEMAGWLTEIAEIVLGYLSLTMPGVTTEPPSLQWEKLDQQDGRLTLDTVVWAFEAGLIDEKTALLLSGLDVENIEEVLAAAKAEKEARQAAAAEQATNENGGQDQTRAMIDAAKRLLANGDQ